MATIIDVAKRAGVSIKTVSRVMNDHAYVRDDTRERVTTAMRELGYAPSDAARRMRTGKSQLIGMLYGDPSSGYQSRLNHAMLQACSEAGTYLVAGLFDEGKGHWREQLESFLDRTRADRMVLVPPMCNATVLQEVLTDRGIGFVLVSPSIVSPQAMSVAMDDQQAAREITQYLIALGHRRLAHISGDPNHVASLLRRQGYEEALIEAGLPKPDPSLIEEGRFGFREALSCAERILSLPERPTAIFAASDDMAAATMIAAGKLGLSVPGDLSIAGFDDTPIANNIWPALTTIAQPFQQMADEAVRLLNLPPEKKQQQNLQILCPYELIVRDSCAAPKRCQ
ncbi:MAG: LacI family DNA-binding transcriptional regulator [Pseudomonadota bacterium]